MARKIISLYSTGRLSFGEVLQVSAVLALAGLVLGGFWVWAFCWIAARFV